jgi:hypothetical protein
MSESKHDACHRKIVELIDAVIARESIPSNSQSYDDLQWCKFYAKEMKPCKDCAGKDSQNETKNE